MGLARAPSGRPGRTVQLFPPMRPNPRHSLRRLSVVLSAVALTAGLGGCSALQRSDSLVNIVTPYRIDIVQGNVVTKEQIAVLKVGMPRQQVREILGTPLMADPFHADRWDYLFTLRRAQAEPQRRSVVVWFEDGKLARFEAPELPSERDFVASMSREKTPREAKLALTPEEVAALPAPRKVEQAAPEPMGPVRTYPPLEPT